MTHHFPLAHARVCLTCDTVTDAPDGCPACGSEYVWPLQKWTDRTLYVDKGDH